MRLKRVIHCPDLHAPFHDKSAWKLFLSVCKEFKPDQLIVHGDFFDFYSVSRHDKDPVVDFKTWRHEMQECRDILKVLESACPQVRRPIFLEGNHEKRLQSYIAEKAPKLSGIYETREILGIEEPWLYLPYGQKGHYRIGKLVCTHGSRAGENPAASMVKKFRSSVAFGHVHKIQEYHITNIHGEDFVGLAIGWLGDQRKAAEYMKDVTDWTKGFLLTWHKENGDFFYQLVTITKKYECMFLKEPTIRKL